jgi:hypothetical protein
MPKTSELQSLSITGTCLQGYIAATRAELSELLYDLGSGDKSTCNFAGYLDGLRVTAYDWKNEEPIGLHQMFVWNIGGDYKAAPVVLAHKLENIRKAGK